MGPCLTGMIFAEGISLVVPRGRWNHSGDVQSVAPSKLRVVWVSPTGKRKRVEVSAQACSPCIRGSVNLSPPPAPRCPQVAALHVHERDRGPPTDMPWDVAVLVLKTPIKNSPLACLDLAIDAPLLPPIATGDVGVVSTGSARGGRVHAPGSVMTAVCLQVETWRGNFLTDNRVLVAMTALDVEGCRAELVDSAQSTDRDSMTDDRFCALRGSGTPHAQWARNQ